MMRYSATTAIAAALLLLAGAAPGHAQRGQVYVYWDEGSSPFYFDGIYPRYYAYSQLVYGAGERLYPTGCLRWGWHNRSWYNHCPLPYVAGRGRGVVVKY
jgi:hypothetical protein